MNRDISSSFVRPNLPLRRPATGPGSVVPRNNTPSSAEPGNSAGADRSTANGDGPGEANRNDSGLTSVRDLITRPASMASSQSCPKLCNYCSQTGNFKCTGCKKTFYCSVACQTKDWKAHRHVCKASSSLVEKSKECLTSPLQNGPSPFDSKAVGNTVVQSNRVYMSDLAKSGITKGAEVQATVVELRNPGRFFIHVQAAESMESLRKLALELQRAFGGSPMGEYEPETGELCAIKYSMDQNWYRGQVLSVDADHKSARVLYIDFGNEEDVLFDKIKPLGKNLDLVPPYALPCCIAGVTPAVSSWSGECTIALRQLMTGKSLSFTIVDLVENGTVFAVDAHLAIHSSSLTSFLIDQGYAVKEGSLTKHRTEQDIVSLMTASFENFKRLSGGKNENTEAQPPEPLTQGVGDVFSAVVTHLRSPSEIICQKVDNASAIQKMQLSLREHCSQMPPSENFRPAPGTVCCSCFSEDSQWYRAKVLAYSAEERVCVGYIDFGNSEEVPLSALRPISVELLEMAMQAVPCALAGIQPPAEAWSEEVVLILKRLVCNRFLRVEILGKRVGTALVVMVDESSDPQSNIAELLVVSGYALPGEPETRMSKAAPLEAIPESPATSGPVAEKLEWSCAELPFDGQKVVLVIGILENPGEFYCYQYSSEVMQALEELSSDLKQHCEEEHRPFTPTVGEPCCALFTGDGRWYRAMVQGVWSERKVKVYFVDYGNSCEVDSAHLKAITPRLLKQSFQAIRCWLAGVEPVSGRWNPDAVHHMQALCAGQQLSARVLIITERGYGLHLEANGHDVAASLVAEKLANPTDQAMSPAQPSVASTNHTEASLARLPADTNRTHVRPEHPASHKSVVKPSTASFPVDWETRELPLNKPFQPRVAAVTSPSLFYVMHSQQVNAERLMAVMADVAKYCQQALPSQTLPAPGAACCAQFSGDKCWYRAVVLETTDTHADVVYADYGNMERVPVSNILPIPKELLQERLQVVRCALLGKEHFPEVWPAKVLELFVAQLSDQILATVQAFDGTFNLMTLSVPSGLGCTDTSHINTLVWGALQKSQGSVPTKGHAVDPLAPVLRPLQLAESNQNQNQNPKASGGKTENGKSITAAAEQGEPKSSACPEVASAPAQPCCCKDLKQKIDQIEELILLLMKQIGN